LDRGGKVDREKLFCTAKTGKKLDRLLYLMTFEIGIEIFETIFYSFTSLDLI